MATTATTATPPMPPETPPPASTGGTPMPINWRYVGGILVLALIVLLLWNNWDWIAGGFRGPGAPTTISGLTALEQRCKAFTDAVVERDRFEQDLDKIPGGPEYIKRMKEHKGTIPAPAPLAPGTVQTQLERTSYFYVDSLIDVQTTQAQLETMPNPLDCPLYAKLMGKKEETAVASAGNGKKKEKAPAKKEEPKKAEEPKPAEPTTTTARVTPSYMDVDPIIVSGKKVCIHGSAVPVFGPPYVALGSFNGWGTNVSVFAPWMHMEKEGDQICIDPGKHAKLSQAIWQIDAVWVPAALEHGEFKGYDDKDPMKGNYWGPVCNWLRHRGKGVPYVLKMRDGGCGIVVNPSPELLALQPK